MEYLYQQQPIPTNAKGVEVTLDAIDSNGNWIPIDRVTSDMSGFYSCMWTPEHEGKYTVIATFEGSKSYWASYAETAIGVGPPATTGETDLTSLENSVSDVEASVSSQTTYIVAILALVLIAVVIAVYSLLKSRK